MAYATDYYSSRSNGKSEEEAFFVFSWNSRTKLINYIMETSKVLYDNSKLLNENNSLISLLLKLPVRECKEKNEGKIYLIFLKI